MTRILLVGASTSGALLLLILDSLVPLGFALWLGYAALLVSLPVDVPNLGWFVVLFCLMIAGGALLSPERAIPLEVIAVNRTGACLLLSIIGIIQTKRGREKTQLAQAQAAAVKANEAKTRFLQIVGHDLRTPLHGILGRIEALTREKAFREEHRPDMEYIESLVLFQSEMIMELIDFANNSDPVPSSFSPRTMAADLVSILRPLTPREVEVVIEIPDREMIQADGTLVRHILLNFLSNAVKLTSSGSIRIEMSRRRGWNILSVTDAGPGLGSKQDSPTGLGLGLTLSEHFAAQLGGRIELVDNAPLPGVRASLMIPAGA